MRISDWSSDVCSSDLAASANPAELSDMHKPSGPVRSRNSVEIAIKGKKPAPERTRLGPFAVQCWRWGFHHAGCFIQAPSRSEEHTSELQSLMRISYAVFRLQTKRRLTVDRTPQRHAAIQV